MEGKYISTVFLKKELPADSYLLGLPVIKYLKDTGRIDFTHDVTFFIGENGSGKSTLLEAIAVACGFNAEGGTKNFNFATQQTHSQLCDYLTIAKTSHAKDGFFFRAESFYNVATNIDELDCASSSAPQLIDSYGGTSLHQQSHGESFLALIQNRFTGKGLYILDEPEAALSPSKILTLIAEISMLVKCDSQFIIATHSPMLMAFPGAQIYQMTSDGIIPAEYQQTEHYQLTKQFLNNPDQFLRYLV